MPLTTTHLLVPLAGAVAFARTPVRWKLILAAAIASAAPDVDALANPIWGLPASSIYTHRGVTHSLFVAVAAGLIAAIFHKRLNVRPLTAGLVVGAAMASHGLLDMMTDYGLPVAYLWPLSSARVYADWRPIHSGPLELVHLSTQLLPRLKSELWQLILPMFASAIALRISRTTIDTLRQPKRKL